MVLSDFFTVVVVVCHLFVPFVRLPRPRHTLAEDSFDMTYGFQGRCFFNPNGGKVVVYVGAELRKAQPIITSLLRSPNQFRKL